LNEFLDLMAKIWKSFGSHSVSTIYCSMDNLLPPKISGAFDEILTEIYPKLFSNFLGILNFSLEMNIIQIN
jgi:hypothetical protein